MNAMPKYVVSSTLREASWNNSTVLRALIEHDLVDELRLMVFPVLLGEGKRLFGEVSEKKPLRLAGSQGLGDGIALLTYEPTG